MLRNTLPGRRSDVLNKVVNRKIRALPAAAVAMLLFACGAVPPYPPGEPCDTGAFRVVDDFPGARRGDCAVLSKDSVVLTIRPEDPSYINDSPWYAFRVEADIAVDAKISLHYENGHHRYWPKQSFDGKSWTPLDASQVHVDGRREKATLSLELQPGSVLVSAQELILPDEIDAWAMQLAESPDAQFGLLGLSLNDRPINLLQINPGAKDVVLLVGRQHPAEVTGSIGMNAFVETLFDDDATAIAFRERFNVIVIPVINPDGVIAGNWRHNEGGVDLNRDWGSFWQPETDLIRELLERLDSEGKSIRLFVDFHSTNRNLMYTQMDEEPISMPGFTSRWVDASMARLPDYEFTQERRPASETANGKNYMYHRYGIPSVTYEVGDETDRALINRAAEVFAQEMMRLLLEVE